MRIQKRTKSAICSKGTIARTMDFITTCKPAKEKWDFSTHLWRIRSLPTTTWNFQIWGLNDNLDIQCCELLFLQLELYGSPTKLFVACFCQQYRMCERCNNRKIVSSAQIFIFKWRFRSDSRHWCLNVVLTRLAERAQSVQVMELKSKLTRDARNEF